MLFAAFHDDWVAAMESEWCDNLRNYIDILQNAISTRGVVPAVHENPRHRYAWPGAGVGVVHVVSLLHSPYADDVRRMVAALVHRGESGHRVRGGLRRRKQVVHDND